MQRKQVCPQRNNPLRCNSVCSKDKQIIITNSLALWDQEISTLLKSKQGTLLCVQLKRQRMEDNSPRIKDDDVLRSYFSNFYLLR